MPSEPLLTDEELIERCRADAGSNRASQHLDELFQRYHSRVAVWCLRITGNRESAADLAQEVFLKVFRNLDSFRGGAKFSTWLYSVARNHCFNHVKSLSHRPREVGEEPLKDLADSSDYDILEQLEKTDSEQRALELINTVLDEVERKVFVMHFAEEMPLEVITRLLMLENASGAKAYIVSAKRKIARALGRTSYTPVRQQPNG